jgi:hypothetical protein
MKPKPSHQQNLQELVYSPGRPLTPKTPLFSEAAFAQKSYPGAGGDMWEELELSFHIRSEAPTR